MAYIKTPPLKIGLKVDHKGSFYKIIDHYTEENSVIKYVIQSMSTGQTKRVFRHEICDADVSSLFSKLTEQTIFQFESQNSQSDDELSYIDMPATEPRPCLTTNTDSDEELFIYPEPEQLQTTCGVTLLRDMLAHEPEVCLTTKRTQADDSSTSTCMHPAIDLEASHITKKPRFKEMPSRDYLEKLAHARTEKTTNQQTAWGVRLLRGWLTENGYDNNFETLDSSVLNDRLCYFHGSLQTKRGTDYSKSALVGIRAAISRHITNPPFNREVNLMNDRTFMTSNHVLIGLIKTLKREGKDITVHKKPVAEGDVHKLYTSGVFSTKSPITLQNKVFWDIMFNFGRRGQEGLDELTKTSYGKYTDDKGHTYYKIKYNEANKTHHGVDSRENIQEIRMYAKPGDEHCPVESFDLYLSKLSPKCDALFQQPLQYPKPNCWYAAQKVGKNKLAQMMSRISKEAGLSTRYTNHCIRATVATGLKRAGVDDLSIMSVTGHRNVKSLQSYIAGPSEAQRRDLSTTIQRVATARNSEPVSESDERPVSQPLSYTSKVSNINTSLLRNPLSDINLFNNSTISGGTFTINLINKD